MDAATGSLGLQAGSFVQSSGLALSSRAALSAFEHALAQLSDAGTGLLAVCRSCETASPGSYGSPLTPGDMPGAAANLLIRGARTVHAVIGRPDLLGLLAQGLLLRALDGSGAQAKVLCQDVLRTEMGGRRALSELTRAGAQVATTAAPPPAVVIVDRRVAIAAVAEQGGNGASGATLVHDPSVAGYMAAAVDAFWAIAAPLHDAIASDSNGLFPADRALLRLLAEGMTQQEAARKLHLSARTISRRTAGLKRILGAASPLQAGLEAARRGWV